MRQIESPETHNSDKECIYDKDHILNQQEKNYYLTLVVWGQLTDHLKIKSYPPKLYSVPN